MSEREDWLAEVPLCSEDDEIRFVHIVVHEDRRDGVHVFLHESISEPCLYDQWFLTVEEAFAFGESDYGISRDAWETAEQLKARGIEVFDEE